MNRTENNSSNILIQRSHIVPNSTSGRILSNWSLRRWKITIRIFSYNSNVRASNAIKNTVHFCTKKKRITRGHMKLKIKKKLKPLEKKWVQTILQSEVKEQITTNIWIAAHSKSSVIKREHLSNWKRPIKTLQLTEKRAKNFTDA